MAYDLDPPERTGRDSTGQLAAKAEITRRESLRKQRQALKA